MRSPLPRSFAIAALLAASIVLPSSPARAADRAPAGESVLSVTVRPGDSWEAVRGRMFPVQSLKQANPGLDANLLHPGEVVRAPYVRAGLLARERAAREDAEGRLAESRDRVAALEREILAALPEGEQTELSEGGGSTLAPILPPIAEQRLWIMAAIGLLLLGGFVYLYRM